MTDNYPTWRAAHCVQCWKAPEACDLCGCHINPDDTERSDPSG